MDHLTNRNLWVCRHSSTRPITCQNPATSSVARRGAAAIELALTLPLLLLMAFGCVELGRAVAIYCAISNAACAGAEYGSTHVCTSYTYSSWQTQVIQDVQNEVQGNHGLDANLLTATVSSTAQTGGYDLTTVTASYKFQTITTWPGLPSEFTLSHSVSMRRYR